MQNNLEYWVNSISESGLPALSATVNAITKISPDSDVSAAKLAEYINQDPGLTSHILRHTQSAYRVPVKGKSNTVNRAIVMLGFNEIRSLCLGLSILEDLTKSAPRAEFLKELGLSFHAAVQARSIAFEKGCRNCEEIFTATLLSRIGSLSFWGLAGEQANKLSNALKESKSSPKETEIICLGFSLDELTQRLTSEWNLNDLFNTTPGNINEQITPLAYKIAENSQNGWDSEEFKSTLKELSKFLNLSEDTVLEMVKVNSVISIRYALGFGIPGISRTLESISEEESELDAKQDTIPEEETLPKDDLKSISDESFQLLTLRSITTLIEAGTNINELVKTALEGMHKGLAVDRAIFYLLTPNRKSLVPKFVVNSYSKPLYDVGNINVLPKTIFGECIQNNHSIWRHLNSENFNLKVGSEKFEKISNIQEFIVLPVSLQDKVIGMFYVDRGERKEEFSQNDYESIKYLVFQIKVALEQLQKG